MDLEDLRLRYVADRPLYERLVAKVGEMLRGELQRQGITAGVEGRPKEVASLIKKALRKGYANPWQEIRDKAGVRIVTSYEGDIAQSRRR